MGAYCSGIIWSFQSSKHTIEVAGTTFLRVIAQKMRKVLKFTCISRVGTIVFLIYCIWHLSPSLASHCTRCSKSNGSYDIKDFGTLSLIFSTSKYFRRKFQPCPSFFSHPNIPDKWKRVQLSLDQMKKRERVKVNSKIRYLAACSFQKMR